MQVDREDRRGEEEEEKEEKQEQRREEDRKHVPWDIEIQRGDKKLEWDGNMGWRSQIMLYGWRMVIKIEEQCRVAKIEIKIEIKNEVFKFLI